MEFRNLVDGWMDGWKRMDFFLMKATVLLRSSKQSRALLYRAGGQIFTW